MKKVIRIIVIIVILAGFVGTIYFLYAKSEEKPVTFQTTKATTTDIIKKTVATGSVVPRKEIEIKPQVSGIIDKIYVEAGSTVKEGDRIALVKIIPNMVSLNNAQNRLRQAKIALENARMDLERNQKLKDKDPSQFKMLLGFDGFVDEIIHVVDKRQDPENFTRVKTIKEFN
jgi:HlyD family secretion protein